MSNHTTNGFGFRPSDRLTVQFAAHRLWQWMWRGERRIDATKQHAPKFREPISGARVQRAVSDHLCAILTGLVAQQQKAKAGQLVSVPVTAHSQFAHNIARQLRQVLRLKEGHSGDLLLDLLGQEFYDWVRGHTLAFADLPVEGGEFVLYVQQEGLVVIVSRHTIAASQAADR